MELLQNASLIVTPNAYKQGKLYSIVPSDGTGDFTVTRATSATRVNSAGLIEIPVTNLINFSEEIDNVIWIKSGSPNIIANFEISPSGLMNADRYYTSLPANLYRNIITTIGINYTFSVYIKSTNVGVGQNIRIGNFSIGFIEILTTNNWVRYQYSFVANGTSSLVGFTQSLITSNTDILIWGAQLEQNVSATEYIPTTSVVRTRFAGITQDGSSASNIPRIDYTNTSCPSILVEQQRTNLLLQSEQFQATSLGGSWTFGSIQQTLLNITTSPSGLLDADKIFPTSTLGSHFIYQLITTNKTVNQTASCFFKASEYTRCGIKFNDNSTTQGQIFDLISGQIIANFGTKTTAKITNYGNGWYRCEIAITAPTDLFNIQFTIVDNNSTNFDFIGDNTKGLLIWGAQLELGENATSYIPTTTAAVTRNGDAISNTNASTLIGQIEGTIFVEINRTLASNVTLFGITRNIVNSIFITITSSGLVRGIVFNKDGVQSVVNLSIGLNMGVHKIAFKYSPTSLRIFVNGIASSQNNVNLVFNEQLSRIDLTDGGTLNVLETIRNQRTIVFKKALTDSECITLTTL